MLMVLQDRRRIARLVLAVLAALTAAIVGLFAILEPTAANPASGFTSVVAGTDHTCAVTTGGGAKCWGSNHDGELGDGTHTKRYSPVDVVGLTSGVASVAAADNDSCAVTTSGGAKCWGRNTEGQLGDGTLTSRTTPVNVVGLTSGVAAITVGSTHTCALTTSGGVKCWGDNFVGELGDGTHTNHSTPVDVVGLSSGVTAVEAGAYHTCALTTGGGVKCWGVNFAGQLGDGSDTDSASPVDVVGLSSGVASISVGGAHSCALTTGGGIKCWGINFAGQLGDGTLTNHDTPVPVFGFTSGAAAISAGDDHTCALTTTSGVRCWGGNDYGQLGDGSTIDRATPVDVLGPVSAVTSGAKHSCALLPDSTIQCWGYNLVGQLGDGGGVFISLRPTAVVIASAKPTPTATPCPQNTCPTATATPTRTPTPMPGTGLNFSMGIDTNGDTHDDCDTGGGTTTCSIGLGSKFLLKTYLDGLPSAGYGGFQIDLTYAGVLVNPASANTDAWPPCNFPASFYGDHNVEFGCASAGDSTFIGQVGEASFTCAASGMITMNHGPGKTELYGLHNYTFYESAGAETLNIECVVLPTPTPTARPVGGFSQDLPAKPTSLGARWPTTQIALLGFVALLLGALGVLRTRTRRRTSYDR